MLNKSAINRIFFVLLFVGDILLKGKVMLSINANDLKCSGVAGIELAMPGANDSCVMIDVRGRAK